MTIKLDAIDYKCIDVLLKQPLATWREVSEKVDVTERTVARRMQKLLDEKTFRVLGETDPLILKKGGVHHVWIKCQLGMVEQVATSLKNMTCCKLTLSLTGSYDLFAEFHFDSYEEMLEYTFKIIPAIAGVQTYDNNAVLRHFKQASNRYYHEEKFLTKEEQRLIELLLQDGRAKITELSAALNLSSPTVKGMIDQLTADRIISYKLDIEPMLIGFATEAIICLEVSPSEMPDLIEVLQASPFTRCLFGTSGKAQVFWHVVHKDNHALWDLVGDLLKEFKGINHMNLNMVLHAYKRSGYIR